MSVQHNTDARSRNYCCRGKAISINYSESVAYRGGGGVWGVQPPPRNSEDPPKSCQTQPDCENCYKLLNLGRQHTKMFGKKGSKILKLPRFAIHLH